MGIKIALIVLTLIAMLGAGLHADAQIGGTMLAYQTKVPTVAVGSAPIITLNGTRALLGGNTGTQ